VIGRLTEKFTILYDKGAGLDVINDIYLEILKENDMTFLFDKSLVERTIYKHFMGNMGRAKM